MKLRKGELQMPIENAEARGGRRMGMMIEVSKTAALRREIVLISGRGS